jgi:hypothetical protein
MLFYRRATGICCTIGGPLGYAAQVLGLPPCPRRHPRAGAVGDEGPSRWYAVPHTGVRVDRSRPLHTPHAVGALGLRLQHGGLAGTSRFGVLLSASVTGGGLVEVGGGGRGRVGSFSCPVFRCWSTAYGLCDDCMRGAAPSGHAQVL